MDVSWGKEKASFCLSILKVFLFFKEMILAD